MKKYSYSQLVERIDSDNCPYWESYDGSLIIVQALTEFTYYGFLNGILLLNGTTDEFQSVQEIIKSANGLVDNN